ncbi:MAG: AbrB/MazE/SpoVT family DNA-binding domain-containing protein [Candidatus Atribacteria bacterium]|nr:AbrB/MazE/SpoVT family DNA-binding domain-containing protein [Candidatus Atribacteria bacterium]
MITTKVYDNNQTAIPSEIRKMFKVQANDIVEWIVNEDGEININFRKRSRLDDIVGIVSSKKPIDSVKIQKRIDHGEEIDSSRP